MGVWVKGWGEVDGGYGPRAEKAHRASASLPLIMREREREGGWVPLAAGLRSCKHRQRFRP